MKPMVGYLVKTKDSLYGERGMAYDYILSGNGVWIEAEGPLMAARVPVALAEVRGLAPLEPKVALRYGKVSKYLFDLALGEMLKSPSQERYVAITFSGGYHIQVPEQKATEASVEYANPDSVMLDLHSHGPMGAWFSTKDNEDEKGMKLYGVVGKLPSTPQVRLRVGVYGYFYPIGWGDVFDGYLTGAVESEEEKEAIDENELHGDPEGNDAGLEYRGSWLRWDWWFRRRRAVPAAGK